MKILLIFLLGFTLSNTEELINFSNSNDLSGWRIVDDVVMGGRSDGHFELNKSGNAIFYGDVSTANNGGFSSVRYQFKQKEVSDFKHLEISLKGDGKRYQFRVKSDLDDRHSYITYFETSGDWETIKIPISSLYPSWRGIKLSMPDYPGETMEELAFLISNERSEQFKLEVKSITLK